MGTYRKIEYTPPPEKTHSPGCKPATCTLRSTLGAGDLARKKRWKIGDILIGDEGYGPTKIVITAIGIHTLLAATLSHRGSEEPHPGTSEGSWVLYCRCWKKIGHMSLRKLKALPRS